MAHLVGKRALSEYAAASRDGGLAGVWSIMSRRRRRYARQLVERFGWPVRAALQEACLQLPAKEFVGFPDRARGAAAYGRLVDGRTGAIGEPLTEGEFEAQLRKLYE